MAFSSMNVTNKRKAGNDGLQGHAKRVRTDYKNMIMVFCGNETEPFSVHKDVLISNSAYFRAACSNRWAEGQGKTVRLSHQNPEVFRVYLDWVYRGELTLENLYEQGVFQGDERAAVYQIQILRLYFAADYLLDIGLCKQLIIRLVDSMYSNRAGFLTPEMLHIIYDNTPPESALRVFIVNLSIARLERDEFAANVAQYPQEFIAEVAMALLEHQPHSSGGEMRVWMDDFFGEWHE